MSTAPFELELLNLAEVRAARFEVAVLPLGATEPHNLHLPYGTDSIEAREIGRLICAAANSRGGRTCLLPTLPFGTETNLREFPLALNLNPSTMLQVITDLVATLDHNGIHKLLLLNSHGGNDLKPVLRELHGRTRVQLFLCNWYQAIADVAAEVLEHRDDHAGEMETSLMLHLRPELVARSADGRFTADEGATRPSRFEAIDRGWVSITRPWHLLTTNSGAGNPHSATADKGARILAALTDRLGTFLAELSTTDSDRNSTALFAAETS